MDSTGQRQALTLRIFGGEEQTHTVDAFTLAQALEGLQKAAYVLAMERERRDLPERGRYPEDIVRRFALHCSLPQAGSYAVPLTLGGTQVEIDDREALPDLVQRLLRGVEAIGSGTLDNLRELIPGRHFRARFLDSIRSIAPKAGSPYKVGIGTEALGEKVLSGKSCATIRDFERRSDREEAFQTITGQLHVINFKENKIKIFYPVTQRLLDCTYDPDIEELLIGQRRDWVQVSGTVILDDDTNEPRKITDVVSICDLDTTPFFLEEVPLDGGVLRFRDPLTLQPQTTESRQLMFIEDEALGINTHATTRDDLLEEVYEQVRMLWLEYAKEADDVLSPPALELKRNLLERVEEMPNGA